MAKITTTSGSNTDLVLEPDGTGDLDINTDTIKIDGEATTINLLDNSATALTVQSSDGTDLMVMDTTDSAEKVSIPATSGLAVDTISEKTSATGVTIDGTLIKDNTIQPASGQSLVLQDEGGDAALTIDTFGNTEITNHIEQETGKTVQTSEIRAKDGDGLKLYDDSGATGIFVKDGGAVGVKTTNPDGTFHISSGSAGTVTASTNWDDLVVENSGATGITILTPDATTGTLAFGTPTSNFAASLQYDQNLNYITLSTHTSGGALRLRTDNGSQRMFIDSSGNIQFSAYGSGTLSTDASGNITASDERLKTRTRALESGLDLVNQLTPTFFKWKENSGLDRKIVQVETDDQREITEYRGTEHLGFIAQEVQSVIPEASHSPDDPDRPLNYEDRGLIAVMVKAIQELSAKVTALENA